MSTLQGIYTDIFKKANVFGLSNDLDKQGDIKVIHNKEIGKRVLKLHGDISSANFIRIPSLKKRGLYLSGRYFIIEFCATLGSIYSFHLDFDIPHFDKIRLSFCNIYKDKKIVQGKTIQIPLVDLNGKWTYLVVDLKSYIAELYYHFWKQKPNGSDARLSSAEFDDLNLDIVLKNVELCAKMSVRSCWISDVIYHVHNIPKEMAFLLPKGCAFEDKYNYSFVENPIFIDRHIKNKRDGSHSSGKNLRKSSEKLRKVPSRMKGKSNTDKIENQTSSSYNFDIERSLNDSTHRLAPMACEMETTGKKNVRGNNTTKRRVSFQGQKETKDI